DNEGDIRLTVEALRELAVMNRVSVVRDGRKALAFLRREAEFRDAARPDLIFLDLNLPGMNGKELLREIKNDDALKSIPVLILSTSTATADICEAYRLHANCYVSKPVDLDHFFDVMHSIHDFWLNNVELPH
ncbi:MAG: response regulator, partial [Calditrichaeota bacterium]